MQKKVYKHKQNQIFTSTKHHLLMINLHSLPGLPEILLRSDNSLQF